MSESLEIKQRVFKVVSNVMGVPLGLVDVNSSPDNIEGWDSLKQLNLVLALEEEFGIFFDDQQIVEMLNVELILVTLAEVLQSQ
ncbi:MAG: acyl carrier protein [Anaerolineales bacterium]|nr:acyl carrier protein [Anaerolineales bacterium]